AGGAGGAGGPGRRGRDRGALPMSATGQRASERGAAAAGTSERRAVSMRTAVAALLRKELLVELRTLESVPGVSLFALAALVVLELVAVPAFALLLAPPFAHALPDLLLVLALGDIGVAVVGTLVAALAVRTRARDLLGPLLGLPLMVPIVIGGARASSPLFAA